MPDFCREHPNQRHLASFRKEPGLKALFGVSLSCLTCGSPRKGILLGPGLCLPGGVGKPGSRCTPGQLRFPHPLASCPQAPTAPEKAAPSLAGNGAGDK